MILTTVKTIEGVQFISDIEIVEPREKIHGVYVELIGYNLSHSAKELPSILHKLGLRHTGYDINRDSYIYAFYPWGYYQYKIMRVILKAYWWSLWFLYNNTRVFKEIPHNEVFSWHYFTPYVWVKICYKKIKTQIRSIVMKDVIKQGKEMRKLIRGEISDLKEGTSTNESRDELMKKLMVHQTDMDLEFGRVKEEIEKLLEK